MYDRAAADPEAFWEGFARELDWIQPWSRVLEWKSPHAKWFVGGKLNVSANCLDRHIRGPRRNKAAFVWEGEPGDRRTLTYWDLYRQVNAFANVLKSLGVKRGDRVALYMPLIPELAIAMLACSRIGAVHSVVFGGFSAESLRDRINDAQAVMLVTADGGYRRGQIVPLKQMADEALRETPSIRHVVVVQRQAGAPIPVHMQEGRDHWYHRLMQDAALECAPEPMDAEDMLYILYTSGTTGKPKGIVHTTGGYLTGAYATTKWVFDLKEDDVYWCTADIGWVTGHSYVVYGPLANGATVVMYEGAPDWPQKDRMWEMIERLGVTIFYTAPTAIRAFMRWGVEWPAKRELGSLRLLGSVGEPINPEAWMWYHLNIGRERCPIVDTWWQTETGMIMITPLPGITSTTPGSATRPFPGVFAEIRDKRGQRVETRGRSAHADQALARDAPGHLRRSRALREAGPGANGPTARTSPATARASTTTASTGCSAAWTTCSTWPAIGSGTMEVESALVDHPRVAEAAVVGKPHEIKGQAVAAFVTLKEGSTPSDALASELKDHVVKKIGAIARPDQILFTADLPKTRSRQDHAPAAARHRRRQGARRHDHAGGSGGGRQTEDRIRRKGRLRRRLNGRSCDRPRSDRGRCAGDGRAARP